MISGILLAAGNSIRMGEENKLLLPVQGQALFLKLIQAMEGSKLDELIVVLGHDYKKMIEMCKSSRLKLGINGNHLEGQTSSIKAGMQLLNPTTDAVMICLCDMPLITSDHLDQLIQDFEGGTILRPMQGKRPGNPSIFSKEFFPEIMDCVDNDGCKSVLSGNIDKVRHFETPDTAFFVDIDTPGEYANFTP